MLRRTGWRSRPCVVASATRDPQKDSTLINEGADSPVPIYTRARTHARTYARTHARAVNILTLLSTCKYSFTGASYTRTATTALTLKRPSRIGSLRNKKPAAAKVPSPRPLPQQWVLQFVAAATRLPAAATVSLAAAAAVLTTQQCESPNQPPQQNSYIDELIHSAVRWEDDVIAGERLDLDLICHPQLRRCVRRGGANGCRSDSRNLHFYTIAKSIRLGILWKTHTHGTHTHTHMHSHTTNTHTCSHTNMHPQHTHTYNTRTHTHTHTHTNTQRRTHSHTVEIGMISEESRKKYEAGAK